MNKRINKRREKILIKFLLAIIIISCIIIFLIINIYHPVYYNYNYQAPEPIDNIPLNNYSADNFHLENSLYSYEDNNYKSILGIDISAHNGNIDFSKVAADGIEFVFLRVGYRGYSQGSISIDDKFEEYYQSAKKAGLKIGVYFFSQAIDEKEAMEEAYFVLEQLRFKPIDLEIAYDYENIDYDDSRMHHLTKEERTDNALAFASKIKENGYEPIIYTNEDWAYNYYDLNLINNYKIWFAKHDALINYPYPYIYWQFTAKGRVDGIDGEVDLNLFFKPKNQ